MPYYKMSASQILGGSPAALRTDGGVADLGTNPVVRTSASTVGVAGSGTANLQLLESPANRYWARWIGLPGAGVSRGTLEDWGYDAAAANTSIRYTQYKAPATTSGNVNDDIGLTCLNWGLLDAGRSGVLAPLAGPAVLGIPSITASDQVWFFPQAIGAVPFVLPVVASIQVGTGFTLTAPIPAGETWRYLVVATKTV